MEIVIESTETIIVQSASVVNDQLAQLDMVLLKKKKKKKISTKVVVDVAVDEVKGPHYPYTWMDMYSWIKTRMIQDGVDMSIRKSQILKPRVEKSGSKKVVWSNYADVCISLQRTLEHVMSFFLSEMSAKGSLTEKNEFIIVSKITSKEVEKILKDYIEKYVVCHGCKNNNSVLLRDTKNKLQYIQCSVCNSTRVVQPIKQGFKAVTKQDRKEIKREHN